MEPIDMAELKARGPASKTEELRIELYEKVNALGIGAQGLGGLSTVLDVKIFEYPTHAASKPVAMIPNCAATRHVHFTLDGSGPAKLDAAETLRLAEDRLGAGRRRAPRESRHADARGSRELEAGRTAAAQRPHAHGPRRRAQAHRRSVRQGRGAAARRRFPQSRHLLRRPGRSGARRSRGSRRPDDRDAHGQVHRDDAREDRPHRDGRQGRARARPASRRFASIARPISWRSAARPTSCRRPSRPRAWWRSKISAWKRSTSSPWRTCR